MLPRIALTPGEPAGIGPDIVVQVAQKAQQACLVAFAEPDLLLQRARQLGLPLTLHPWRPGQALEDPRPSHLWVSPVHLRQPSRPGAPDKANISYVLDTLCQATDACRAGELDALVTGPVNKGLFHEAGVAFSGHTEFLARRCESPQVVMLLANPHLRVALLTTHLPLKDVPAAITAEKLRAVLEVLHRELGALLSKAMPRIFVLGLNPHAGDGGALGREEQDILIPTLDALRQRGLDLTGPLSADTAFSPAHLRDADVFLAMYHDQGLPVLKALGFGEGINITLGLGILRTSVDHGTAYELAGTGRARPDSLQHAVDCAARFCLPRHQA